jgi:hypothetical protein
MDYSKIDVDNYEQIVNNTTSKILDTLKDAVGDICSKQDGIISKEQFDMIVGQFKDQIIIAIDDLKLKAKD